MPVTFAYDANGTVRRIQLLHPNTSNANLLNATLVNGGVDRLGRITQQNVTCQSSVAGNVCGAGWSNKSMTNTYSIQGWIVRQAGTTKSDSIRYDVGGNRAWQLTTSEAARQFTHQNGSNRLYQVTQGAAAQDFTYDGDGARLWETDHATVQSIHRTWYDARGRVTGDAELLGGQNASYNNYGPDTCQYNALDQMALPCHGAWLMFDGDNVVGNLTNGTAQRWSFVHGPGLDDPLIGRFTRSGSQTTVYFWVTDGSGGQLAVALDSGLPGADLLNDMEANGGVYAGGTSNAQSFSASRFEGGNDQGPAYKTGMSFFRNRLYDQSTGRWTQEDPIGVAGGINLYQFNGNNPASYIDPFGLAPDPTWLRLWVAAGMFVHDALDVVKHTFEGPPRTVNGQDIGADVPIPEENPVNRQTDEIIKDLEQPTRPSNAPQPRSRGAIRGAQPRQGASQVRQNGKIMPGSLLLIICVPCVEGEMKKYVPTDPGEA